MESPLRQSRPSRPPQPTATPPPTQQTQRCETVDEVATLSSASFRPSLTETCSYAFCHTQTHAHAHTGGSWKVPPTRIFSCCPSPPSSSSDSKHQEHEWRDTDGWQQWQRLSPWVADGYQAGDGGSASALITPGSHPDCSLWRNSHMLSSRRLRVPSGGAAHTPPQHPAHKSKTHKSHVMS